MREFNTSGPCNPALHYTVMREALIAEGKQKVHKGRFFTLFAPRQSGKTTYFQLLLAELKNEGFTPVWISFENLSSLSKDLFYKALTQELFYELSGHNIETDYQINNEFDLGEYFRHLQTHIERPIVLVIDEFEGIPDEVVGEVMHTFRKIYHRREHYCLHSLLLIGVSTISELVLTTASPFNIATELEIPYFTFEEVKALINQYVTETGQIFEANVIKAIYDNTQGQPGLVCALCLQLVTKVVTDKSQAVTLNHFYQSLQFFLTRRLHKNIINIVQKARQKREFILKLLFQSEPIPFSMYEPDIAWLYANGVVDEIDGYVDVIVPLYKKVLITAFRPLINGEITHYITSPHETLSQYLNNDGGLNINALLEEYRAYVHRRGFRAFDTENLGEGACHYSLDGFINFFIERIGGQTYIEVPSGKGRIDILIRYRDKSYIIETKRFTDTTYFKRGKAQLAAYLKSEQLSEGYYVVFSDIHSEADEFYSEELIEGKRIYSHIILINFDQPSRLPVPDELRQ